MKYLIVRYRDALALMAASLFAIFLILGLSACGSGYLFTPFKGLEDGVLEGGGDNIPNEIVPGSEPGTLVPGGGGDDGWTPPDPGSLPDDDGDGFPNEIDHFPNTVI